jgi:hypothetical protein
MKIQIGVVLAILVVSFGRMDTKTSTLSGWVSDESCGPAHIRLGKNLVSRSASAAAPASGTPNGCQRAQSC